MKKVTHFSVIIPTKKYLAKYFTAIYGSPIELNSRYPFTDTILTKIVAGNVTPISKEEMNIFLPYCTDKLHFKLPLWFFHRMNHNIDESKVVYINRFLQNCFDTEFFQAVCIGKAFGLTRIQAIEGFANNYGIILEEDVKRDSLKKKDIRLRKMPINQASFTYKLSEASNLFLSENLNNQNRLNEKESNLQQLSFQFKFKR